MIKEKEPLTLIEVKETIEKFAQKGVTVQYE